MNMRVRYKIKAQNMEDLDTSMEVTIDSQQVQQTQRYVQIIDVTFKKKSNNHTPTNQGQNEKNNIHPSTNDFSKNLLIDTDIMASVNVFQQKPNNTFG